MFIPPHGFRHAATLLISNRLRAMPADALPHTVRREIDQLAHDLVALADDMRAPADAAEWLIAELDSAIDRLPQSFDRDAATSIGREVLARVESRTRDVVRRDVFLVYVPEDRLPVAAPLAVELAKRRITVAFAEYEVASAEQLAAAVRHGLAHHRAGAILQTRAFNRMTPDPPPDTDRLRTLNAPEPAIVDDLVTWVNQLKK